MADRTVRAIITGSSAGAVAAFTETALAAEKAGQSSAKSMEDSSKRTGAAWSKLSVGVGLAIVGIAGMAVDMANKYDDTTAQMAANSGINADAAKKIGDAFLQTGGQTIYSAQQMMTAFAPVSGQLATLNGAALTATQATNWMAAAMDLAQATGQPLNDVVSSLAQTMQAYAIPVAQAAAATDLLTNLSHSLNMPVSDVVTSVDKLHAKLGPLSPSLQDVGTLLEDVATHGLTGNRALMLVSTGFNTLLGNSKPTNAELQKLGINLYDSNGKFVGMQSVIAQLNPKLAGMTEQQRLAAEKTLFGAGASKALDATLLAGLPGFDKSAKAVDKVGTAHAGATTATDTLGGSFDRLKGKITNMLTDAGGPLMKTLKDLADWANAHLNILIPVFGAVAAVLAIAGVVKAVKGAVTLIGDSFKSIVTVVKDMGLAAAWAAEHVKMLATSVANAAKIGVVWVGQKLAALGTFAATTLGYATEQGKILLATSVNAGKIVLVWVGMQIKALAQFALMALNYGLTLVGMEAATSTAALVMVAALGPVVAVLAGLTAGLTWLIQNRASLTIPKGGNWWDLGIKPPGWKPPPSDPTFGHAAGGYFTQPHVATFGEVPEFVLNVPQMAGLIRGTQAAAVRGGPTSVVINVLGGDPQAVVKALRQYMQQNGSIPITVNAARRLGAA